MSLIFRQNKYVAVPIVLGWLHLIDLARLEVALMSEYKEILLQWLREYPNYIPDLMNKFAYLHKLEAIRWLVARSEVKSCSRCLIYNLESNIIYHNFSTIKRFKLIEDMKYFTALRIESCYSDSRYDYSKINEVFSNTHHFKRLECLNCCISIVENLGSQFFDNVIQLTIFVPKSFEMNSDYLHKYCQIIRNCPCLTTLSIGMSKSRYGDFGDLFYEMILLTSVVHCRKLRNLTYEFEGRLKVNTMLIAYFHLSPTLKITAMYYEDAKSSIAKQIVLKLRSIGYVL